MPDHPWMIFGCSSSKCARDPARVHDIVGIEKGDITPLRALNAVHAGAAEFAEIHVLAVNTDLRLVRVMGSPLFDGVTRLRIRAIRDDNKFDCDSGKSSLMNCVRGGTQSRTDPSVLAMNVQDD